MESFSRAGEELHLTHGAISRAVRTLEQDLGVALFERRSRRVFLTEAGRKLFRAVHEGLGIIQDAVRDVRATSRRTPLVVSCEPTLLMRWLIPRWPAFQERHPDVAVHLVAGGGPFSFDQGIDLAIRRNDFDWPADIAAIPLFKERIGPVCSPARANDFFEWSGGRPSMAASAIRLHTKTRPNAWRTWAQLNARPLESAPEQTFEHFYFSLQAAVAGLGVAIGPWYLVCDEVENNVLTAPLGFIEDGSMYYLLSPVELRPDSPQARLCEWLRSMT